MKFKDLKDREKFKFNKDMDIIHEKTSDKRFKIAGRDYPTNLYGWAGSEEVIKIEEDSGKIAPKCPVCEDRENRCNYCTANTKESDIEGLADEKQEESTNSYEKKTEITESGMNKCKFEYGEKIEVSDNGEEWTKVFFYAKIREFYSGLEHMSQANNVDVHLYRWKYARKIKKKEPLMPIERNLDDFGHIIHGEVKDNPDITSELRDSMEKLNSSKITFGEIVNQVVEKAKEKINKEEINIEKIPYINFKQVTEFIREEVKRQIKKELNEK